MYNVSHATLSIRKLLVDVVFIDADLTNLFPRSLHVVRNALSYLAK